MQNLENVLDLRPSLVGSIAVSQTATGAPIDTQGFGGVLATLVAGAAVGTGGNYATLDVKIQECATVDGTFTDVTDGTVQGSWAFDQLAWADITDPQPLMGKKFEHVSDGVRKRYIRAHATCAGTAGSSPKFVCSFLLGNPVDTVHYIVNPTSQTTNGVEFYVGR